MQIFEFQDEINAHFKFNFFLFLKKRQKDAKRKKGKEEKREKRERGKEEKRKKKSASRSKNFIKDENSLATKDGRDSIGMFCIK